MTNTEKDFDDAYGQALRFLNAKECTAKRMFEKLHSRGHSEVISKAVVDRLVETHLIDDLSLAKAYALKLLTQKANGAFFAKIKLKCKGVEDEMAEKVVDEISKEKAELIEKVQRNFVLKRIEREVKKMGRLQLEFYDEYMLQLERAKCKQRVFSAAADRAIDFDFISNLIDNSELTVDRPNQI